MRISTAQMFQQGISTILDQQSQLQRTQEQITTGRRVLRPSDDPVAAVQILDINEDLKLVDQYQRNASLAEGQLALEESALESVGNVLQRVRELLVQGNNASLGVADRRSIGLEIGSRLEELLSLANTRDANDEYIFAGYQAQEQPFTRVAGEVVYNGDDGQRFLQLAASSQVAVRDSGNDVFMSVPAGNGRFTLAPAAANSGTAVIAESAASAAFVRDQYSLSFAQATSADPVSYQVTDSLGAVVDSGNYDSGGAIEFAGARIVLQGQPADGDSFNLDPAARRDMFSTVQALADTLVNAGSLPAEVAALNNALGQGLVDIDQALDRVLETRSDVGVRMNRTESQQDINADFTLKLQESLSAVQDLDLTEAISRLNLQLTALEAAQQTYIKTQGLSLFNYL